MESTVVVFSRFQIMPHWNLNKQLIVSVITHRLSIYILCNFILQKKKTGMSLSTTPVQLICVRSFLFEIKTIMMFI